MILEKSSNNMIVTGKDFGKEIIFQIFWYNIKDINKTVLVYYKNLFLEKKLNEIWDNMQVLFLANKYKFSWLKYEAFISWMSIYKEFDEQLWINKYYLYKFDKQNIQDLNNKLKTLWIKDITIIQDWKFTEIKWWNFDEKIFEQIKTKLLYNEYDFIFSFLLWILIWYGNIDISNSKINSTKVHIPLKGSILKYQEKIIELFELLFKNSIFVRYNIVTKTIWNDMQIVVDDIYFLEFIKKILFSNTSIFPKQNNNILNTNFQEFINQNNIQCWFQLQKYYLKSLEK